MIIGNPARIKSERIDMTNILQPSELRHHVQETY